MLQDMGLGRVVNVRAVGWNEFNDISNIGFEQWSCWFRCMSARVRSLVTRKARAESVVFALSRSAMILSPHPGCLVPLFVGFQMAGPVLNPRCFRCFMNSFRLVGNECHTQVVIVFVCT